MSGNYKATIITPFHNTDINIFKETFRSVKAQTIGFENIEWVIVLHNCEQKYIDAVKELAARHENVKLKELKNNSRSASSPRNYGLNFINSPYVEFLDSDDTINEKTIETCLDVMARHKPQVVVFRMAYKKQNESVTSVITDVTLWNPLKEEIVLTGEKLRCKELFSSINLCLHNRFFDAEYIKRNNFKFDEEIIMAEDVYFTLLCYEKAEKIVVLPQFIGHNYFVNSKSAVQNNVRSREVTLKFSYGYKKIFDLLLNMGAYYNHFFITLLNLYVKSAYRSPDFTAEDWATLRREMGPYAKMLTPPPVNKLFSKEQGQAVYEFVTSNLLEDKVNDHSAFINGEDNLRLILKSNADTAYGDFYNFNNIKSADEYRRTVPIVDEHDYKKLMRLNMEVGETGLITKKKMKAYAYDFNASDEMRVFPMSEESCFEAGQNFANKLFGEVTFLMMETKPKGTPKNDGTYLDSPIGIMVNSAFEAFSLAYRGFDGKLTMPLTLLFAPEQGNMDYITLLMALRNENVTQIYSSNTWVVFNYLELLFKRGAELCDDIAAGNVKNNNNNSEYISRELAVWNQPDAKRADEIREALKSSEPEEILLKIWPNLKRVIARSSGNYNFYTKKLKKYFKNIKLEFSDFVTPFGIIAKQDGDNFKIDYDKGFYEFLPVRPEKTLNTLLVSEVKTGNLYELVLTNIDGLYRMRTGIIIKPVKVNADEFCFEECMRLYIGDNKL